MESQSPPKPLVELLINSERVGVAHLEYAERIGELKEKFLELLSRINSPLNKLENKDDSNE